jgi:hypothetical protein
MKELEEKLNLHSETILPFAAKDSPIRSIKFSEFLALLVRQNYLQKVSYRDIDFYRTTTLTPGTTYR